MKNWKSKLLALMFALVALPSLAAAATPHPHYKPHHKKHHYHKHH